ncbi:conserved hypothetical protein [Mucor ambiguus]|uniref:Zinc finger PHD-type domain-containing protein n=1 Tax=Mucor ambiguus TaxID=91626 RepID=A0A0C9MC78_9FUNG|nr:conserved hypothetical protein [Mucor ambiguus]
MIVRYGGYLIPPNLPKHTHSLEKENIFFSSFSLNYCRIFSCLLDCYTAHKRKLDHNSERFKMNFNLPDIQKLRNNIDFCSIAQFFHTFAPAFGPWPSTAQDIIYARPVDPNSEYVFETEDLERMLLETSERIRLEDLFVRMLRLVTRNRFINSSNWQTYYSKEFDKREYDQINPLIKQEDEKEEPVDQQLPEESAVSDVKKPELVNYFTLDLDIRVYLLHLLCEWQLDEPERFREHLNSEEDAVQWRVDPIGFDKKGSTFWLFDDNRLYKETPKPKPVKKSNARKKKKRAAPAPAPPTRTSRRSTRSSAVQDEPEPAKNAELEEEESEDEGEWIPWKLLCYTKHEWENFPAKYANSKNIDEQRFYRLLMDDLLPKVLPVLEEHEEKIRKQEAMIHRKRSSRIMIKELEALERGSAEPVLEDPYSNGAGAAAGGHGRNRSNRLEQRALEKEQQEKEALAKAREERLLERERRIMEREYRALKRQASEDATPEQILLETGPIVIDGTTPLPSKKPKKTSKKSAVKTKTTTATATGDAEQKPKRKYVKKPKFDENGNPIPRKVKLDKDGNPIPLKKRGRKPKNRDEDHWLFDCECGVSGENIDDGTPLVACEKCGTWQHIACLQKSGQIASSESMDNLKFVCQKCERHQEEERERKRQREQYYSAIASPPVPGAYIPQMPTLQSSWQPQQQQTSPARPSSSMPIAQQPPQPYRPPTTSVLPPIRSHPPNQAQQFQPPAQAQTAFHQIQQRPVVPTNYQPLQPQQGHFPPIAMNSPPPSQQHQQPLLNSAQTYPQATVSQQQTIQSIVSQVASNPVSLAQLANLLDKNLQRQQQQQQQQQKRPE